MANRVTSKGQVTIPKRIREHLGIRPGQAVEFDLADDGRVTLNKAGRPEASGSPFDRIRGSATVRMSTEEIMRLTRGD
jgi:AbrB family looped-hinge helix DNA binding protein